MARIIASAVGVLACAGAAAAGGAPYTIGFDGLAGTNGAPYFGHSEGGYDVAVFSGSWFEAHFFGNPTPAIYGNATVGAVEVSETTIGQFTFSSVDLATAGAGTSLYTIEGFFNDAIMFSTSGELPFGFATIASPDPDAVIDTLRITFDRNTTSSYNIDNIVVTTIPTPAASLALAAGLGGLGLRRRR